MEEKSGSGVSAYGTRTRDCPMSMSREWRGVMTVDERRVFFVYEAARIAAIAAEAPIVPEPWEQRDEAFRKQMTEAVARQCGPMAMSAEEAHGAWVQAYIDMGWRYGEVRDPEAKTHPDMVPYAQLRQLERDKDEIYVALCRIAAQYITEAEGRDA